MVFNSILAWIYGAEFDVRSYVKDFYALATGKHKKPLAEYAGKSSRGQDRKKLAVVAIYPNSPAADFSLVHLLKSLKDCGFWVLLVSTMKLSEEQRGKFGIHCDHVIERHGIGRDFGSYQMGLRWLGDKGYLQSAEVLILANDSMFYPAGFAKHIRKLINSNCTWGTLFENFERHFHSQSFFQIFRPEVFRSKAFGKFWRSYWPFSTRAHSIDQGEVGLSKALMKAKFVPHALFRSDLISQSAVRGLLGPHKEQLIFSVKHALDMTEIAARKFGDMDFSAKRKTNFDMGWYHNNSHFELEQRIATVCEYNNPTHRVGLLCNVLFNAPLKRDLVYRGTLEIGTLVLTCKGFTEPEKNLIRDDLLKKGPPQSLKNSHRLTSLYKSSRI